MTTHATQNPPKTNLNTVAPAACYDPTDHVPSCRDEVLHGMDHPPYHCDRVVVHGLLGWYWETVVVGCEYSCGTVPVGAML